MPTFTGGCLCGAVRYTIDGDPVDPHLCFCRMCQRASGAPVTAWVSFPRQSVAYMGETRPTLYRSSQSAQRGFCPKCGSQLFALDDGGDSICMMIGSCDDPDAFAPEFASFSESAPSWLSQSMRVYCKSDI